MGFRPERARRPYLLFGLFAGAWVDRLHRRPTLIAADLGRAVALGIIPLAAMLHGRPSETSTRLACHLTPMRAVALVLYRQSETLPISPSARI